MASCATFKMTVGWTKLNHASPSMKYSQQGPCDDAFAANAAKVVAVKSKQRMVFTDGYVQV